MDHKSTENSSLLEQSGNGVLGYQFPDAPHTHMLTMGGKGCAKSVVLLQKGEQNVPNTQSSQAIAPPLGGRRSLHFVAV